VEAYLKGLVRVRVAAVFEGDARLEPPLDVSPFDRTAGNPSRVYDVGDRFKSARPNAAQPSSPSINNSTRLPKVGGNPMGVNHL